MITTISFSAIAEWVVAAFAVGLLVGGALTSWLFIRFFRK